MINYLQWMVFFLSSVVFTEQSKVEVKVVNRQSEALYCVHVKLLHGSTLIATTDEKGNCDFESENLKIQDTIVFTCLGFESFCTTVGELLKMKRVVMEEKNILLEETIVKRIKGYFVLKQATNNLKKVKTRNFRFYGKGQYEKITECQGKAVELRREYGAYCTGGNVYDKSGWEYLGKIFFIPCYSARSYSLTADSKDTLSSLYHFPHNIGKPENFDAGVRKIFWIVREVQAEGPLFNNHKAYQFQQIEGNDQNYHFRFRTKRAYYPSRTALNCEGSLVIDYETCRLKSITFDYLQEYKWKHYLPVRYRLSIEFDYDEEKNFLVKACRSKIIWNPEEDGRSGDMRSRAYPGKNGLVEEEAFMAHSFDTIPASLGCRMYYLASLAEYNPQGKYDPELFTKLPKLLDSKKAEADLNNYMDIGQQFRQLSNRPYYPKDFFDTTPYKHYREFNDEHFYERFDACRKTFLSHFFNDNRDR